MRSEGLLLQTASVYENPTERTGFRCKLEDSVTRDEKKQYVEELTEQIKTSDALFLANYKGLTFPQLTAIRTAVKEKGSDFKVVKNTLVKIALHNNGIESLDETLKLCTACTIVNGDVASVAKDMKKIC